MSTRAFKYNQLTLTDPDPNLSPEEVKSFYASLYPELTQAVVEGPESKEGTPHYTFRKVAGTKGNTSGHPNA